MTSDSPTAATSPPAASVRQAIVVGGDALALSVAWRLREEHGVAAVLVWRDDPVLATKARQGEIPFFAGEPSALETLRAAGIESADVLLATDSDEQVNLDVALAAREVRPTIRLVMRQFNRELAEGIERNLADTSVLSSSRRAAATYAAAALDPTAFHGVCFPERNGPLYGFSEREERSLGAGGRTVRDVEREHRLRVVAIDGAPVSDRDGVVADGATLIVFGSIDALARLAHPRSRARELLRRRNQRVRVLVSELDPIVRIIAMWSILILVGSTIFFSAAMHLDWLTAAYFVVTTMTTTGYGDITVANSSAIPKVVDMALMVSGVVLVNLALAFVVAAIVRSQSIAKSGVRQTFERDHVVVCGAGRVGQRVVEILHALSVPLIVIEANPNERVERLGREVGISLFAADATDESAISAANIAKARAVVTVTNGDTSNLEVALAARARNPIVPVVMRIGDPLFARRIAKQFGLRLTFSAADLAAPLIAALAFDPDAHGLVTCGSFRAGLVEVREPLANDLVLASTQSVHLVFRPIPNPASAATPSGA